MGDEAGKVADDPYPSGFRWVLQGPDPGRGRDHSRWALKAPTGRIAATVYLNCGPRGHVWFAWGEDGVGGENSSEPTVEAAKITAESAVLRWGRHFRTAHPRGGRRPGSDAARLADR